MSRTGRNCLSNYLTEAVCCGVELGVDRLGTRGRVKVSVLATFQVVVTDYFLQYPRSEGGYFQILNEIGAEKSPPWTLWRRDAAGDRWL